MLGLAYFNGPTIPRSCSTIFQQYQEEIRSIQFLMALHPEFGSFWGSSFFHWSPLPTVDVALSELIAEEIYLLIG